jgi:chromosome segregation ATPase
MNLGDMSDTFNGEIPDLEILKTELGQFSTNLNNAKSELEDTESELEDAAAEAERILGELSDLQTSLESIRNVLSQSEDPTSSPGSNVIDMDDYR